MAGLRATSRGGLAKYIADVKAMVEESMKGTPRKRLRTTSVPKNNVLVKPTQANVKALSLWEDYAAQVTGNKKKELGLKQPALQAEFLARGGESDAKNLKLDTDKGEVTFGQLWKPTVNVNLGDMAEGVFAAAITARFRSKNKEVKVDDVFRVLQEFNSQTGGGSQMSPKKGVEGDAWFDSPNKPKHGQRVVDDKVHLRIALAEVNMKGLLDPKMESTLRSVASSSATYANGTIVMANAKEVYENNIFNQINVIADGISGQKKTKVDVYVEIGTKQEKPVRVNINVSLKAGSTSLVGQVGGNEFEKQVTLWGTLLGGSPQNPTPAPNKENINYATVVKGIKKQYDTFLTTDNDPIKAITKSYETVQTQLNVDFGVPARQKQILENLARGISYYSTYNQGGARPDAPEGADVTLVQLKNQDARIYSFKGLLNELTKFNFKSQMKYSKVTKGALAKDNRELPTVEIFKDSTVEGDPGREYPHNDLLKIRTKIEYKTVRGMPSLYFKNYVEKGKLLSDMIGKWSSQLDPTYQTGPETSEWGK